MDVSQLKQHLFNNPDDIVKILDYYGYEKIKIYKKEVRCARGCGGNQSSIRVKLNENLTATDFGRNVNGDIISIIMKNRNLKFVQVLNEIKNLLHLRDFKKKQIKLPFGGMFQGVCKTKEKVSEVKTFEESILNEYDRSWNVRFFKDNIAIKIQKEFNIGYDSYSNRITVPWRNVNGKIIGIMGRINVDDIEDDIPKWFPIIPFSKSNSLYGFSENYEYLLEDDTIFIGESEKFVLQLASYGYRNSVCLGGNNLSEYHIKYILGTNPKKIYFCYDEGLDLEVIKRNIERLKPFLKMKDCNVYSVCDRENVFLKKNSKNSPSDLGRDVFEKLIKECSFKII